MNEQRQKRLTHQKRQWRTNRATWLKSSDEAEAKAITAALERGFERGDTRVVEEFISRLREAATERTKPSLDWFISARPARDVLAQFLACCEKLDKALVVSRPSTAQEIQELFAAAGVPKDCQPSQLEDAAEAVQAWRELKKADCQNRTNRKWVIRVLTYLGFEPVGTDPSIDLSNSGNGWVHFAAQVAARCVSIPQFGSLRDDHYDVVSVWEKQGVTTLGARLRETGVVKQPTIVLYLGRLTLNQRLSLAADCRQGQKMQILFVDETWPDVPRRPVGEPTNGLSRCRDAVYGRRSVQFAVEHGKYPAGNVLWPPRHASQPAELRERRASIVYGELNKLGKSALLRRVQQEFHKPDLGHYAIYQNIKLIGSDTEKPALVWDCIRDQLNEVGIFDKSVSAKRPDQIIKGASVRPSSPTNG